MRRLRGIIRRVPGMSFLDGFFRFRYTGFRTGYIAGHFHSPFPRLSEIKARAATIFNRKAHSLGPSLELRKNEQRELLEDLLPFYPQLPWRGHPAGDRRFHIDQKAFRDADAIALFGLLRKIHPRRVIEVGSGFSSALMLDTNEFFLNRSINFTFIDPYPEKLKTLLRIEDRNSTKIIGNPVQDVPLEVFDTLEAGDFLFVDSSHVSKIGSDVNWILFEILPNLNSGVYIHFHDIFWPFEYPKEWVYQGRFWNEAYLLRAFLQYNREFEIVLFNSYVKEVFEEFLSEKMPDFLSGWGGSLWLKKT